MEYSFKLTKEQVKYIIEILNSVRAEGESEEIKRFRQNFQQQYKSQYNTDAEIESLSEEDYVESVIKKAVGSNYCDNCD